MRKGADKAEEAAEVMGITAPRLLKLGLIDEIIPEPLGGAHRNMDQMAETLKTHLVKSITAFKNQPLDKLLNKRYERWLSMGQTS